MKKIIGFHKPDEPYGYLSNWYLSDFVIGNIRFSSMEQYMMYNKAVLFNDRDIARQILAVSDVGKIKELGRCVSNYNNSVWNGMRQIIIYKGLLEKFRQNNTLSKQLSDTGDAVLAECAVNDLIWGIGISMTDPAKNDIRAWKGQNLLCFALQRSNTLGKSPCFLWYGTCLLQLQAKVDFLNIKIQRGTRGS